MGNSLNEENICPDCGDYKKEEYELCFVCNQNDLKKSGNICECGSYKKEDYDTCFDCYQEND